MNKEVPPRAEAASQDHRDLAALRQEKTRQLLMAALAEESPLRANLQAGAASLLETSQILDGAIKEALREAPKVLRKFVEIESPFNAQLRCIKLANNLIDLDHRIEKSHNR